MTTVWTFRGAVVAAAGAPGATAAAEDVAGDEATGGTGGQIEFA
jgi:hypothetical protein